jgi:hypothetical protein
MRLPMYTVVEGRRLEGVEAPPASTDSRSVGAWLARAAYKDATSALAFARLVDDLKAFGAPADLVARCERAKAAEQRHARQLGRLATRFGAMPESPSPRPLPLRPLVKIAIDNAVDGLVWGAYGSAVAKYRARHATDETVRRVMEQIAVDEREHVRLAFEVAMWLHANLDPIEAIFVEDSMRHAVTDLARKLDELPEQGIPTAGVPGRLYALAIWRELSHAFWNGLFERVARAA